MLYIYFYLKPFSLLQFISEREMKRIFLRKQQSQEASCLATGYLPIKALVIVLLVTSIITIYVNKKFLYRTPIHFSRTTESGVEVCNFSDFQVIEPGSAFLYSAYIDDRHARDVSLANTSTGAVVRLLVYYLRTIDATSRWKCRLFYSGQTDHIVDTPILAVTDLDEASTRRFLVAMVVCDFPKTPPHYVLRSASLANRNHSVPFRENSVCVVDLRNSSSSLSKSTNQDRFHGILYKDSSRTETNDAKGNHKDNRSTQDIYDVSFTVCTSPIHGKYYKIEDIVNFIEVNRLFGAEKFVFYVDNNTNPKLINCFEAYRKKGIVELYSFTPTVCDGLHYHGQIVSISDCAYRTMYRTRYLINQDPDEVIVPLKTDSWTSMLKAIHSRVRNPDLIASYSFRNQFFPLKAPDDIASLNNTLIRRYNIKALLKTSKENYIHPHVTRSKVMARPDRILMWHVHLIHPKNVIRRNDTVHFTSPVDALLFHYRSVPTNDRSLSRNGKLLTERRMLKFTDSLIDRVQTGMNLCSGAN